jgi:hypothetical protein
MGLPVRICPAEMNLRHEIKRMATNLNLYHQDYQLISRGGRSAILVRYYAISGLPN